jgi:DNA repair exonuclease SbcCD ATPase subunit
MRVTRLLATNFLGYEEVDLDFSGIDAVVAVGPIGTGKTSLMEAVKWALWGESRGEVLDEIIRDEAESCSVTVEFTVDGKPCVVERTKTRNGKSTLSLEVDGEVRTRHTLAETEQAIVLLIGLTYEAALAGPVMDQFSEGSLMRLEPRKRKDVLLGLFGLQRFAAWEEAAKQRRDSHAEAARSAQAMIDSLGDPLTQRTNAEATLAAMKPKADTLGEAVAFGRERVTELSARVATLRERSGRALAVQQELEALRVEFTTKRDELRAWRKTVKDEAAEMASLRELPVVMVDPADIEYARAEHQKAIREHAAAFAALDGAKKALAALENRPEVTCPDCGRVFRPDVADGAVKEAKVHLAEATTREETWRTGVAALEANVRRLRGDEQHALEYRSLLATHEAGLRTAEAAVAVLEPHVEGLAARGTALRDEVAGLEAAGPELTAALDELASARGALENNERDLSAIEADIVRVTAQIEQFTAAIARREQLTAEIASATAEAKAFGLLAQAFHRDGVPSLMLERSLPVIEARANDVLGRMPGNYAVRLSMTGGRQGRVDVHAEINGRRRGYHMLSGGQRVRVDLALRFGLAKFDTLFVDESLDRFQDEAAQEALLDSLSVLRAQYGLVWAISHHPSVVEWFGHRIEVSMEDGISHAMLV